MSTTPHSRQIHGQGDRVNKVCIRGTGSYVPERVVPNSFFESLVDTSDEWIRTRTGIQQRRMVRPGEALTDMATPAAERALEMAGLSADQLDLIVVGTVSADMITPSAACIIQHRLGARKAVAFDLNAACPGFIYSLSVAHRFIQDRTYSNALVVGGEVISNRIDYGDRSTCVLFGDGAGAVVLGPSNGNGDGAILSTHLHSDGSLWELLHLPGGGSRNPPSHQMVDQGLHYLRMQGNEVFKHAVRSMVEAAQEALERNGVTPQDLDWFIPHQANLRIMEVVAKRLEIPPEKVIVTVHKYGNTSAASIPTALDEAVRSGKIRRGDLILVDSFGAGFTWGAALFRF
jgi:3-oxoacyl-[acyl-carrier-protein] synthase-3